MLQVLLELSVVFVMTYFLVGITNFVYRELRYVVAVYSVMEFIKNISIAAEIEVDANELYIFKTELYEFFRQHGVEKFNIHTSKGEWVGIGDWCIFDE